MTLTGSNVKVISFLNRSAGTASQIKNVRDMLIECAGLRGEAQEIFSYLERSGENGAKDFYDISFLPSLSKYEREGWLWLAASAGVDVAISQIVILSRMHAMNVSGKESDIYCQMANEWELHMVRLRSSCG